MQSRSLSLAVAAVLVLPVAALTGLAHAAGPLPEGAPQSATDLDGVAVTATRTAIDVDTALAPVEVIDRAEIERSQARSLPDLLRGRAGVSMSNQGGTGKLTTLFLRGSESDHVVVLVDGIRIGSATSGLVSLQNLPLALVERVEIVRGPRSSLYGSEAIGGVIQIFTRRVGDAPGYAPRLHVGGGSHGAHEYGVGFGGRNERTWFGVDYEFQRTEGFNACDVATPDPFAGGCFITTPEPDLDGYIQNALALRGGIDLNDAWQLSAVALRSEGENDFDGDFTNRSETVQQVVGGSVRWQPSDTMQLKLTAGRNVDASEQFKDGANLGNFDTDRDSASLQGDFGIGDQQMISAGVDWLRDRVAGSTTYDESERSNRAAFAQYQGRFGAQSLQASVRRDDNDQFGGHTTGSAAWGIDFADNWRLSAGYGTAFKAPTFNELYYPFFGNAELRPEESKSAELGLGWNGDRFDVRLDAFQTTVDDLIAFDAAIGLPNNIDRARMRGAELGIDTELAQWQVAASVSFLDTESLTGFQAGNDLPRRARESARLELDRAFGDFRIGLTGAAEGARFDDVANTRRLPGYTTLDLRAEYALTDALTLQGRLANVFDRDYETVSFYNQPGREWFVTLRYAPAQ
ncbi:TonB-dependent vitamin B12 receptor [Lysobacter sp. A286]